jgi:cation-dependent mannose-6-phosphate receptor
MLVPTYSITFYFSLPYPSLSHRFLIFGMVYIVFMTLYNRYALHLRGFDQIPTPPPRLARVFSAIGDCFSSLYSSAERRGLNPTSHHWGGGRGRGVGDNGLGVGGSRFGSGARREEEEAMLGGEELDDDIGDDLGDVNPWRKDQGTQAQGAGGVDSAGVIRL